MGKEKNSKWKSKLAKVIIVAFFVFLVAGVSSVAMEKYIFPRLSTLSWFENQDFFKKAMENVTVINKTEEVTVSESGNVSGYTDKSAASIVEIVARPAAVGSSKNVSYANISSQSGTIVTADGLVASFGEKFFSGKDVEYKAFSQDGKSYGAKVVVADPYTDLVLLKLDDGAQNLPVAEFIAPEDIKVGTKTVFIGRSGFNAELSLRFGLSSELAKDYSLAGPIATSEKLQGVLFGQLNPGNSLNEAMVGGAAADQNGNSSGIIGSRVEDSEARYFVVPANHVQFVIDKYLDQGKIERAGLGVYYVSLSKETAFLAGNSFDKGALVWSPSGQQGLAVIAGSAADVAGIKLGDIILGVNNDEINPDQNLAYLISGYKPGDRVTLKINRGGQETEVKVTLQ
ncbi:MAG: PDZ domain-containing protein [Candidatus Moranbacteria bacterium]|nr:PDZ domain-containing protein [Candidatus Moranbacteria bacterium]